MNVKPIKHLLSRKGNVCHFRLCISSQQSKGSEDQLPLLLCCLKKSLIIPRMYELQQKKHKLLPVPSGLSLFLCEYCFLFALSPVPSAYQTQSTNTRRAQWDWGDEAQDVNPPVLIHSASLTQVPQTLCVLQKVKIPSQLVHWRSLPHPSPAEPGVWATWHLWKLPAGRKGSSCQASLTRSSNPNLTAHGCIVD